MATTPRADSSTRPKQCPWFPSHLLRWRRSTTVDNQIHERPRSRQYPRQLAAELQAGKASEFEELNNLAKNQDCSSVTLLPLSSEGGRLRMHCRTV